MVMDDDEQRAKRLKDFNDLQDENAGRDTGKIRRFSSEDRSPVAVAARQSKDRYAWTEFISLQMRLEHIRDRMNELDRASLQAYRLAERKAQEAQDSLDDIQRRATVDEQGRRIYRTEDGQRAFYENGQQLTAAEKDKAKWREGSPSWEQHQDASKRAEEAIRERDAIKEYREMLEKNRDRTDDLDGLEKDLENMPQGVRDQLEKTGAHKSAAHEYMNDRPLSAPDLTAEFAAVKDMPSKPSTGPKPQGFDL